MLLPASVNSTHVTAGERPQGGFILNCNAVKSWPGKSERMHADNPIWRPQYKTDLWHTPRNAVWGTADFRCLHICFWPRSSLDQDIDQGGKYLSRWNPREAPRQETGFRRIRRRLFPGYCKNRTDHKNRWYRNSELQAYSDLGQFGRPDAFPSVSLRSREAMERIESVSRIRKEFLQPSACAD